ncbi:phosphoadenosine phosphosulfate reductase family protein [Ignisphaera sp. 4213-co]|uniref:Phosphoadenosine phosphosulfate reductase family protein n=1 Tax=Ignisphaera cupida TaxID=3050454 RepID=A0ABD4Z713_9CREN|nr:phosphoadenosine phosphosulfate reductase family protein [Ignisphaera sp. 4213-co]MDK6029106.1 phosphoadenosine phosphosulfate reductase family protein [Ignisphaera sp. 4213-co]
MTIAMGRRIFWPKIKRFYWCPNCNVPLLEQVCPVCKSKAVRIPLSDPGDARPAFERDYILLQNAYRFEFSTDKGLKTLLGNSIMLLNKAPYYDEMKEVYVDGVQIGRLYFDPFLRKWRFRLSKVGALRVLSEDSEVVEKVVVDKSQYSPLDIIRVDKNIEKYKQVLLVRRNDDIVGLAYSKGNGKLIVHSWWGEGKVFQGFESKSSMDTVMKVNEEHLNIVESQSKKTIALTVEKMNKPVVVSFSGGKDSMTALHLTISLGIEPIVLFNNTGIELPETYETVYKVVDSYNLKLVEASAENKFWSAVYKFGIPGRDYRWCCKICKLAPLAATVKNMWSNGALNIVGQRAFESIDRARSPTLWRLRWAPQMLNLSPINNWSQFEIWLYLHKHKIYVNPLYYMGYERIGCFMCPASTLAELELVSQTHKELWSQWIEVLEYWRQRLNLPRDWIDYGLWRWNAPARYKTIMAKRLGIEKQINDWRKIFEEIVVPRIFEVVKNENTLIISFANALDKQFLENQYTVINPTKIYSSEESVTIEWSNCKAKISSNRIVFEFKNEKEIEKLVDLLKLLYRWNLCVGCKSCESNCPTHTIRVVEMNGRNVPVVRNKNLCIRCKFCLYNCPVAEVFVEHVVAPLIFNDAEAWRRPSREHHNEVLKKIREFVKASLKIPITTTRLNDGKQEYSLPTSLSDFFSQ